MTGSEHEHGHRAHAVAAGHAPQRRRMKSRLARWHRHWTGLWAQRSTSLRPQSWIGRWPRGSTGLWPRKWAGLGRWTFNFVRSRLALRLLIGSAACFAIATLAALGLWWRLFSGPIELGASAWDIQFCSLSAGAAATHWFGRLLCHCNSRSTRPLVAIIQRPDRARR